MYIVVQNCRSIEWIWQLVETCSNDIDIYVYIFIRVCVVGTGTGMSRHAATRCVW